MNRSDIQEDRVLPRAHRWRVRDVMTTDVVTVDTTASYKEVARLLSERKVNAVPVLDQERHVLGMLSEADLLRKQERGFSRIGWGLPARTRRERKQATARTAKHLMTSPAIAIHPDARLGSAARLMNGHHVRRLPVVDESGKLLGIVSRRDLLSVFLRPDDEIAAEIRAVLANVLIDDMSRLTLTVRNGVVVLEGSLGQPDLAPDVVRLAQDVDGVVDVVDRLG
jgi:CBS-domain-containing membrane protein